MSAVLTAEALAPTPADGTVVPSALVRVVLRCLEKAPDDRFQSTRDLAFTLETNGTASGATSGHPPERRRQRLPVVVGIAAMIAGLALAFTAWRLTTAEAPAQRVPARLQFTVDGQLSTIAGSGIAVSHDGRTLALSVLGPDGARHIHTRRLDEDVTRVVPGTEGGMSPFFSPDDRAVGFVVGTDVRRIMVGSGRRELVWQPFAQSTLANGGFDWFGPDSFLLAPGPRQLSKLVGAGASPADLAPLGTHEFGHLSPQVLPGGTHVLYASYPTNDAPADANIMVQPLGGGEPRLVVRGSLIARQLGDYLVYESGESLLASRFDVATLHTRGPAVSVIEAFGPRPRRRFATGGDQTLAYFLADSEFEAQFEWIDGAISTPLAVPPLPMFEYDLSPDGTTVAATLGQLAHYLVTADVRTGTTTRLTTDVHAHGPLFSPDGNSVIFTENGALKSVDIRAGSTPRALGNSTSHGPRVAYGWMPDSRTLLYTEVHPESGADIWSGDLTSGTTPTLLVRTPTHDRQPAVSPDGELLAFTSEEGGRSEVFVQPLTRTGPRRRVTLEGGTSPLWSHDGRRLFWRSADQILSVDVDGAGTPQGRPALRASGRFVTNGPYTSYAVGRDGRLLVARLRPLKKVNTVNVILNLDVEIERLIAEAVAKR